MFKVTCDHTNNTQQTIARNEIIVDVQITPIQSIVYEEQVQEPFILDLQGLMRIAYSQGLIKGMRIDMDEYRENLKCTSGLDMEAEICAEGTEEVIKLLKECIDKKSIVLSKGLVL